MQLGLVLDEQGRWAEAGPHLHTEAVRGLPDALVALGLCFQRGTGVPQDTQRADEILNFARSEIRWDGEPPTLEW